MAQRHNNINNEVEEALTICRLSSGELIRGVECQGDSPYDVRCHVGCPEGEVFALHHTHPHGSTELSAQDISEARRMGIGIMCVSNELETKCWRIK